MKQDKRISRLLTCPSDYTFAEAASLLASLGYSQDNKGATSGSRVRFWRPMDNAVIMLHKPHPQDEMKLYAVKQLVKALQERGDIHG